MKHMKALFALLLALSLILALAGCGKQAGPAPAPAETEAPAETAAPAETEAPVAQSAEPESGKTLALFWNAAEADADQAALRQALLDELAAAGLAADEFFAANDQKTQLDQLTAAAAGDYVALAIDVVDAGVTDSTWALLAVAGEKPVIFFDRPMESEGEEGVVLGMNETIMLLTSAAEPDDAAMAKAVCTAAAALSEDLDPLSAAAQVVIRLPGCTMADGFNNKILVG